MLRRFTREDLAQYHGLEGAPAFVACRGLVYDVSRSFLWRHGQHQVLHRAGMDLTAGFDRSPHGVEVLARFPVVGLLIEADGLPHRAGPRPPFQN